MDANDVSRVGITLHGLREMAGLRLSRHVNARDKKSLLDDVCHGTSRIDSLLSSQHGWVNGDTAQADCDCSNGRTN
jgi:hypothetical protein